MPKSIAMQYFKLNEIVVLEQNYSMQLKTFYKITQLGNKTVLVQEVEVKQVSPMSENFDFYVIPQETLKPNGEVLRLTVHFDGTLNRSGEYGVFKKWDGTKQFISHLD